MFSQRFDAADMALARELASTQLLPARARSSPAAPTATWTSILKIVFICCQREGKGGRRRETSPSCLSFALRLGIKPATQACALTRNQTGDLSLCRLTPNPLSHPGQSRHHCLCRQTWPTVP